MKWTICVNITFCPIQKFDWPPEACLAEHPHRQSEPESFR